MKSNILLVGLDYDYSKCVATQLSGIFDMHYLDVKDLIAYNLVSEQNVLDKAGVEYYRSQVHKIVLSVCEYENAVVNIPYDLFLKDDIARQLNRSAISIFLNLDKQTTRENNKTKDEAKQNTLAVIAYDEFCQLLKEKANLCVDCNNDKTETINKILDILKNINLSELK